MTCSATKEQLIRKVPIVAVMPRSGGVLKRHRSGGSSEESSSVTSTSAGVRVSFNNNKVDWHKDVTYAVKATRWETVRGHLSLQHGIKGSSSMQDSVSTLGSDNSKNNGVPSSNGNKSSFWKRVTGAAPSKPKDRTGLLAVDADGRTPLHVALTTRRTPVDVLLMLIQTEPRAVSVANHRGRFPLHFAVVHRHSMDVIAELVDTFPRALAAADSKGLSPLAYAMDGARRETDLKLAPRTYWMPARDGSDEAAWQEQQGEIWGIVHWLLLSSATHPQTSLSVGGKKPMLVDALIHAAPPAVISLLIGASVMLLSHENRATAFAGSTLYSCIARHYPLTILMSLVSQCPPDIHTVRDETGMGLVSSQYISGCFEQLESQEWTVSEHFMQSLMECIEDETVSGMDQAFTEWWNKMEFLIGFCIGKMTVPKMFLLHAALKNIDVPPIVVRLLLALYPDSIQEEDEATGSLPLYIIASRREYIPRFYEKAGIKKTPQTLEMVLSHDKQAVGRRDQHTHRLPLHAALACGRSYRELKPLIQTRLEALWETDPMSGLLPFLQAATTMPKDTFRWSCKARNKYSYTAWQKLSDREKAGATLKVAEIEELERFDTLYSILRLQPGVVEKLVGRKEVGSGEHEAERGEVSVFSHYRDWAFVEDSPSRWICSSRPPLHVARESPSDEFDKWLDNLTKLLRQSCPDKDSSVVVVKPPTFRPTVPMDDADFLLHLALCNPDTPPAVVELLLSQNPDSAKLPLPDSSYTPLHLAAHTCAYVPYSYESVNISTIEMVVQAHPYAARTHYVGFLPLHLAIFAEKTTKEIECLFQQFPESLTLADPKTGLLPFLLMGSEKDSSSEVSRHLKMMAERRCDGTVLAPHELKKALKRCRKEHGIDVISSTYVLLRQSISYGKVSDLFVSNEASHVAEVRQHVPSSPKLKLSLPVLANQDPDPTKALENTESTMVEQVQKELKECDDFEQAGSSGTESTLPTREGSTLTTEKAISKHLVPVSTGSSEEGDLPPLEQLDVHQSSDDDVIGQDDSHGSESSSSGSGSIVMKSLVRKSSAISIPEDLEMEGDIFECNASVLSIVDAMETFSNSQHQPSGKSSQRSSIASGRGSILSGLSSHHTFANDDVSDSDKEFDDRSLYDDENERSTSDKSASSSSGEEEHERPMQKLRDTSPRNGLEDTEQEDTDDAAMVLFKVRKVPRVKVKYEKNAFQPVKLSKKRGSQKAADLLSVSTHGKMSTLGAGVQGSLRASQHSVSQISKHTASSGGENSYVSLKDEEKQLMRQQRDMMWVGDKYGPGLLGRDETTTSADVDLLLHNSDTDKSGSTFSFAQSCSQFQPPTGGAIIGDSRPPSSRSASEESYTQKDSTHASIPGGSSSRDFLPPSPQKSEEKLRNFDKKHHEPSESGTALVPGIASYLETRTFPIEIEHPVDHSDSPSTLSYLHDSVAESERTGFKSLLQTSSSQLQDSLLFSPVSEARSVTTMKAASILAHTTPASGRSLALDSSISVSATEGLLGASKIFNRVDVLALSEVQIVNRPQNVADSQTVETPMESDKYFDKATMRWKTREKNTESHQSATSAKLHKKPPQKKTVLLGDSMSSQISSVTDKSDMYFDKKSMRWRMRPVTEEESSTKPKQQKEVLPSKPRRTKATPFVDVFQPGRLGRPTPSDRDIRGTWRHMFHVTEKRLCCLLCNTKPREMLMVPCRHLAVCRSCAVLEKHKMKICPLCDAPSNDAIMLF